MSSSFAGERERLENLMFKYVGDRNLKGVKKILYSPNTRRIDLNKIYTVLKIDRHADFGRKNGDTTLLFEACLNASEDSFWVNKKHSISILKELLKHGADPNVIISGYYFSSYYKYPDSNIVDLILKNISLTLLAKGKFKFIDERGREDRGDWMNSNKSVSLELCIAANLIKYNGKLSNASEDSFYIYNLLTALPKDKLESISNYDIPEIQEFIRDWQISKLTSRADEASKRVPWANRTRNKLIRDWQISKLTRGVAIGTRNKTYKNDNNGPPRRERIPKNLMNARMNASNKVLDYHMSNGVEVNNSFYGRPIVRADQLTDLTQLPHYNRMSRKQMRGQPELVVNEQGGGKNCTRKMRMIGSRNRGSRKLYR